MRAVSTVRGRSLVTTRSKAMPVEQLRRGGGLLAPFRRQRDGVLLQRAAVLEVGDLAVAHQVDPATGHS